MDKPLYLALGAFVFSFVLQLIVIYLSHKYNFFIDSHKENKPQGFHDFATPRAGGIGIFIGILAILLTPLGWKLILSALLAFMSGIFEDFHNSLSPKLRLLLQLIAAATAVWFMDAVVTYLGLGITMPYFVGVIFSLFAIVGMMNAINIIDGFNGLASGVILLILISFSTVAYGENNFEILSIILIVMGATFGFFILNFPKAKIFLGDGGAYMLGFIVAIIGIFMASKYENVSPWYVFAIFIYPVWEVIFSILRRIYTGSSPIYPDANHLHTSIHKKITKSNPLTSLLIVCGISPFILASTIFHNHSSINITIAICFIIFYLLIYRYLVKKEV